MAGQLLSGFVLLSSAWTICAERPPTSDSNHLTVDVGAHFHRGSHRQGENVHPQDVKNESDVQMHRSLHAADNDVAGHAPMSEPKVWTNARAASLLLRHTHQRVFAPKHGQHGEDSSWSQLLGNSFVEMLLVFTVLGIVLSIGIAYFANTQPISETDAQADFPELTSGGDKDPKEASSEEQQGAVEKEHFIRSPIPLSEDLYGMAIASLIRDSQRFAKNTELLWLRLSRLAVTVMVLAFSIALQLFLVLEMVRLVTSKTTLDSRGTYDAYEMVMYDGKKSPDHMELTKNGYHRGKDEFFNINNFAALPEDVKAGACGVPLSQPTMFICILLVWTFTCVLQLRSTMELAISLVFTTPTIGSMKDALEESEDHSDESVLVVGLTMPVKMLCTFGIVVPRLIMTCVICWLGCRWLAGTIGFGDLVADVVSLEFILMLQALLYNALGPEHNKEETRTTKLLPWYDREQPSVAVMVGSFLWGLLAIAWVIFYIQCFESVLPDYKWDVHDACEKYLADTRGTILQAPKDAHKAGTT